MPLLMCPNCQTSMQSLNRASVEFDMCPSCRGVWLDRGELEKIMEQVRADANGDGLSAAPPRSARRDHDHVHHEYGERGEHGHDPRRKRRHGFDLFDIFD